MNYEQAEKHREEYHYVVNETYNGVPPFKIKHLLIAPKESSIEEKIKLIKLAFTDIGLQRALIELKMIDKNLDLFIVSENNDDFLFINLADYLSTKNAP